MLTAEISTCAVSQFAGSEQALYFDHGLFAVEPLWLDCVQPGAFARQQAEHDPHALPSSSFHLAVVLPQPGPHGLAYMPRRVVPYQQLRYLLF